MDQEKQELLNELEGLNKEELKAYARKAGIKLYTSVPAKMRVAIAEVAVNRRHHGDAFRT